MTTRRSARLATPGIPVVAYIGWAMALLASLASIYFIEIQKNPAATLCWVDRMLIFSLLLVFSVGITSRDWSFPKYALPFLAIGIPVASFQQLIHWGVITVAPQQCSVSYVCTTKYFNLLGFISQATLCLTAFLVVAYCAYRVDRIRRKRIR